MIDDLLSPYGEDAHRRAFGNVQPGPADFQLEERLPPQLGLQSIEIQGRAAEIGKQMAEEGCEGETQTQHHEEESHL